MSGMGDDGLDPAAAPPLCDALDDETVAVRRTAGDADSDLADPRAIPPMAKALGDPNKPVRRRAVTAMPMRNRGVSQI